MADKSSEVYGTVDTGDYSTTAPNPHVDLDDSSPNIYIIEDTFSSALSNGDTLTVTVVADRDNWAVYSGATYTTGTPNYIDLSTGTAVKTKGTISNADPVTVMGLPPHT